MGIIFSITVIAISITAILVAVRKCCSDKEQTQSQTLEEANLMRKVIWHEMAHAKFWEQYLAEYTTYKLDYRKWYNITTMILSVVGASTFPLWKITPENSSYVPSVIFGLMAITQVLAVFQKNMAVDNEQLQGIIKLRSLYIAYFNSIERLYIENEEDKYTEEELKEKYYQQRETTIPIESLKDSLNIHPKKSVMKKGEERAMAYLYSRFLS